MQLLTGKDAKTHEIPGNGYVQVLLRPSGKSWGKLTLLIVGEGYTLPVLLTCH